MSLFRLFRVLCCYLLYQGFKRLYRLAFRIILINALSISACFGDPNRSGDFRTEYIQIFPIAFPKLRADILGKVGAFVCHRHKYP